MQHRGSMASGSLLFKRACQGRSDAATCYGSINAIRGQEGRELVMVLDEIAKPLNLIILLEPRISGPGKILFVSAYTPFLRSLKLMLFWRRNSAVST